jgi:putative FmdB family regulatory protein
MPIYEYYCEHCDKVFEALRSIAASAERRPCPDCGRPADRIMPTTVATRSFQGGWSQRVPFHHSPVRAGEPKKAIARVTPKAASKPRPAARRTKKSGGKKA